MYYAGHGGTRLATYMCIKELARAQGLNITTFSRKARLTYSQAHKIWHNKVTQLDLRTLDKCAAALDVRVGDLFTGEPEVDLSGP
jgi:DNA-binding Xre family transcriptional regulator